MDISLSWVGTFRLLILAVAAVVGGLALRSLLRARASRTWPRAPGQIVESRVRRYMSRPHQWDFTVRYRYRVDGRELEGWRVYFGAHVPLAVARRIVARFPAGAEVAVAYHPRQPSVAVLIPGPNRYTWLGLLFAPLLGLVAWAVF